MFEGLLASVSNMFVSEAVSKCTFYSLICTYKIVARCDSLDVQNPNALISVNTSVGNQFYNNIGKVINAIKEESSKFEKMYFRAIKMTSRITAICNQPGVVSSGKYCGKWLTKSHKHSDKKKINWKYKIKKTCKICTNLQRKWTIILTFGCFQHKWTPVQVQGKHVLKIWICTPSDAHHKSCLYHVFSHTFWGS